ncbi:unnamed protein product [Tuber melanosporum]|uniref:(Perigord truffle) hypothetical protein n=1 Tax=Tuber melanosporum (strain Mel28) TaxID=656061 RepID=D5GAM9_TUBMM|nr:uncharacterized protein GSTUM_00003691001 [Tuber melanosporum]CAZ81572.1 unnamed protein product [Tuber melanosporum]
MVSRLTHLASTKTTFILTPKPFRWEGILTMRECGPSRRHIWKLSSPTTKAYSHVRLNIFPDRCNLITDSPTTNTGSTNTLLGIPRFRLFRTTVSVFSSDPDAIIDFALVSFDGLAISYSDRNSGIKAANLLLPGRGKDAGNGWETNRSREPGHVDWVRQGCTPFPWTSRNALVILTGFHHKGAPGYIEEIVVDTLHFRGNYSQAVEIYTINSSDQHIAGDASGWELIVPAHSCEADKEHAFQSTLFQNINGKTVTHVKMAIILDGGVKRSRVFGKSAIFAGN